MTRRAACFLATISLATSLAAGEGVRPFDLYQPIIDRCPFGRPPPGFDPTSSPSSRQPSAVEDAVEEAPLSVQQEELKRTVTANALVIDPSRTVWIGFTDSSNSKAPRNHYIAVGTSEDGWLVKDADPEKRTVTFVKNGVEIDVVVGEGSSGGGGASSRGGSKPARSPLLNRAESNNNSGMRSMRSLRQQRLASEAAEEQRRVDEIAKAREAEREEARLRREEEEQQREQERAEREAERAAEREEYRERLKNLAADLEQKMAERRAEGDDEEDGSDD